MPVGPANAVGLDVVLPSLSLPSLPRVPGPPPTPAWSGITLVGLLAQCPGPDLHLNFVLLCPPWVVVCSGWLCVLLVDPYHSPVQTEGCCLGTPAESVTEGPRSP